MAELQTSKVDGHKALQHLRAKWQERSCPMCGVANWTVQDSLYQLFQFNQGSLIMGRPVIPVLPVICTNCGNTVLVNAITAGLMPPAIGEGQ